MSDRAFGRWSRSRAHRVVCAFPAAAVVVGIALNVGCATIPSASVKEGELECGGVVIQAEAAEFEHAFEIDYYVEFPRGRYCVPNLRTIERQIVMMVKSDEQVGTREFLRFFVRFRKPHRWEREYESSPFGGPGLSRIEKPSELHKGLLVAPPGDYKLVLKYRPGPCGRRWHRETCLAVSEPFRVRSAMEFAIEE